MRVSNVSLSYGGEPVLEGASLRVGNGQFVSLVGPSGSGKSTLLRAAMGLQQVFAGSVDLELPKLDVGILFQDDALLPWQTARQNVSLGLRFRGMGKTEALKQADEWLARLGLEGLEDRYPSRLSGGQRKRVALAQVLTLKPKLILMDEPFASLDAIVRTKIIQDVVQLVEREKIAVLLVTHDLEEAISLSDVVYLLSQGPRAKISQQYTIAIPRPRDLVRARLHPSYAHLLERLWNDLSREVEGDASAPKAAA